MKKYRSVLVALVVSLAFCLPAFAAELRLAQVADVSSMDPHRVSDIYSANVIRQIYSNLVQVDENMEIVPDLAEKWENPDDLTWVFHLRKGVKFHNGEPFTASDVKYSMERIKDPKTASPGATHLKEVVSVEAVDDYTVKIVTRRPFAPMLMSLTRYETSILNEKAVSAAGADYGSKAAVGTGPFKFVSWSRGDKVILEKNADYFRGSALLPGARHPASHCGMGLHAQLRAAVPQERPLSHVLPRAGHIHSGARPEHIRRRTSGFS